MDANGSLATLRHGFKCYGRTLYAAFFKAAHELTRSLKPATQLTNSDSPPTPFLSSVGEIARRNPEPERYPHRHGGAQNPLTGQTVENAIHQYRHDRDPREPIFEFKTPYARPLRRRYRMRPHDHAPSR